MDNELLSNLDLFYFAQKFNIKLINVLSKDKFKTEIPQEGGYIVNLENYNQGNGTHWTALIIRHDYVSYFDSFGLAIPKDIKLFISVWLNDHENIDVIHSIDQIQTMQSINCGWYCLYFLWFHLVLNKGKANNKLLMNKHNSMYSLENKYLNDNILKHLIKNILK